MSCACTGGQQRNVEHAREVERTRLPLRRWAMMGTAVGRMFVAGTEVVRK